jgi:uncharacterized membrane protein YfcA
MMDNALIAVAVLATSTISGILGMGGGMILMGIFLLLVPLEWAMILHGCTQLASNGSRAWLHRGDVERHFLPRYLVGAIVAYLTLSYLAWAPSKALAFMALGSLPLVARIPGLSGRLDITRGAVAVLCGATVFGAQVLTGASGPALDVFFLTDRLNRYQIIATKALTQTLSHAMKIVYFATILANIEQVRPFSLWLLPMLMAIPPLGSYLGKRVLHGVSDSGFLSLTRYATTAIGVIWLVRGIHLLLTE